MNSEDLEARFDGALGFAYCVAGAWEQAVLHLGRALERVDDMAYARCLVDALLAQQRYDEAREVGFRRLPHHARALDAAIDALEGRPVDKSHVKAALALAEIDPIGYYFAGVLASSAGGWLRSRSAPRYFTRFVESQPGLKWMCRDAVRRLKRDKPSHTPHAAPVPSVEEAVVDLHTSRPLEDFVIAGYQLSLAQYAWLAKEADRDPDDIFVRASIIGAATKHDPRAAGRHVLWFVERMPGTDGLGRGFFQMMHPWSYVLEYLQAIRAWRAHLEREPEDPQLLRNAAWFFTLNDRRLSRALLERGCTLFPHEVKWPQQLLFLHRLSGDEDAAVEVADVVLEMSNGSETHARGSALSEALKIFVRAEHWSRIEPLALELLELSRDSSFAGQFGHQAHLALGHAALSGGDVEGAGKELLLAAGAGDSPTLVSFGPNMRLALRLLQKGVRAPVLEYFAACARFWERGRDELTCWTELVKRGKIPDFGPNLEY